MVGLSGSRLGNLTRNATDEMHSRRIDVWKVGECFRHEVLSMFWGSWSNVVRTLLNGRLRTKLIGRLSGVADRSRLQKQDHFVEARLIYGQQRLASSDNGQGLGMELSG